MGPKKTPRNDFYYFMQDQKTHLRQQGYVWNSMPELAQICSPLWNQTPEREKAR
jgi:hypothetical protein